MASVENEQPPDPVLVKSDLGRERDQHLPRAEIEAIGEVCPVQRLDKLRLGVRGGSEHHRLGLVGEPQQPVRVEGVRDDRAVEIEAEPLGLGDSGDLGHHGAGPILATEAPAEPAQQRLTFARQVRIKLKRPPTQYGISSERRLGQRRFQTPFAQVAPWADHVSVDLDMHGGVQRL